MTAPPGCEDWWHLRPYGYAPGKYTLECRNCKALVWGCDKRAILCRTCAERRHDEDKEAIDNAPSALESWVTASPERARAFQQECLILALFERIHTLMRQQNMTRAELAKRLSISETCLTNLLDGTLDMTLRQLSDIAHVLGHQVEVTFETEGRVNE